MLQFNEDLSKLSSDFLESLNIVFQDLIDPHDSDEDIANEQEKRIQQEKSFRLEEAKRMMLEEERKLQIAEVKKRKHLKFMNLTHVKNILGKFTPTTRNDVHSVTGKTKPKESWVKIKKYCQILNDPSLAELLKKVKPWVELLLQNSMPLFYANGDKYATPWIDVDQDLHDYELEKCREFMKSISETQLKVLKKISFIAKLCRQ
nr:phospholipase-like protein [Tanacetum cinerariifolium]